MFPVFFNFATSLKYKITCRKLLLVALPPSQKIQPTKPVLHVFHFQLFNDHSLKFNFTILRNPTQSKLGNKFIILLQILFK